VHIASAGQRDIDILVVGEINPDIILSDPDPVPVFGEQERIVGSIALTVGSSSAIFACGAARLGLRVAFVGVVGDDPFGRFMLETLASRGIDVSGCRVDASRPTGATVVLSSGHDRAILTAIGTIGAMDVDAVPAALLARSRHVHSGSYYLQEASRARLPGFFAAARAGGSSTSFDTNWDPSGSWSGGVDAMLRVSDLFFPNATEARAISREADLKQAARALARIGAAGRSDGGPTIVVKRGVDGALACSSDGQLVEVPAMPVTAIDTTGAGDSFDAGFLCAWLEGASLGDAMRLGAACGALSTLRSGGVDGQPTRSEAGAAVDAWLRASVDGGDDLELHVDG